MLLIKSYGNAEIFQSKHTGAIIKTLPGSRGLSEVIGLSGHPENWKKLS